MSLISGKEAKLAWANGEKVLIKSCHWGNFYDLTSDFELCVFDAEEFQFRLKPRTININGIEVPESSKRHDKDQVVWVVNTSCENWYDWIYGSDCDSTTLYWKTEDEVKQVVQALRSIFSIK